MCGETAEDPNLCYSLFDVCRTELGLKVVARRANCRATGTQPVDGDSAGGQEQLSRLCGNVLPGGSGEPEREAWVLPYLVTLRSVALALQRERRRGRLPDAERYAEQVLEEVQTKMDRWPVEARLPAWLTVRRTVALLDRMGVDASLTEQALLDDLQRP